MASIVQSKMVPVSTFGTSMPFAFDTTPTNGNLILLVAGCNQNTTLGAPSGFDDRASIAGTSQPQLMIATKTAGSSESNSYPFSTGSAHGTVIGFEIENFDAAILDTAVTSNHTDWAAAALADITTVTDGALVIAAAIQFDRNPSSFTAPSGWTASTTMHTDRGGGCFHQTKATAGAVTGGSFAADTWPARTFTIAIRPASGGGGTIVPQAMHHYRQLRI